MKKNRRKDTQNVENRYHMEAKGRKDTQSVEDGYQKKKKYQKDTKIQWIINFDKESAMQASICFANRVLRAS